MRGFAEQDTLAVGVYGTMQAPRFMYVVLGTAEDMEGLPLEAFLDLMAAGGNMAIQGDVATRTEGPVDAACGSTDDASLAYMCVTIDDGSVDALFGFEDAPPDEQLDIAICGRLNRRATRRSCPRPESAPRSPHRPGPRPPHHRARPGAARDRRSPGGARRWSGRRPGSSARGW